METKHRRKPTATEGNAFTAKRVVAELEKHGVVMGDKYDEMKAQRDELRGALEALLKCAWHHSACPSHPPGGDDSQCNCGYIEAEDDARAALSKAKEGR